jgi:hypothetical protein
VTFDATVSRPMWEAVERYHAICYLAPEVREEATAAGLKGFWMNYFATRAAPMGPVGPAVVLSTFFYYAPVRVYRAIPDAWSFSTPGEILAARYRGTARALRSIYGDAVDGPDVEEAATLVAEAVEACDPIGRALYAGWSSLPWPDDPHLALWHGCTLLREFRSGNHLIAVAAEGLTGCESVVSHVAVGEAPRAWITDEAGWNNDEVAEAEERLRIRGWLGRDCQPTDACYAGRRRIEDLTDRLDFPVWKHLGEENARRLFDLMSILATRLPPDDQLDWKQHYDS